MFTKTIAAAALAVFLASTAALAQYASPGPTAVDQNASPAYSAPYAYGPNGYDTWSGNRRALHQHRGVGDTNGW